MATPLRSLVVLLAAFRLQSETAVFAREPMAAPAQQESPLPLESDTPVLTLSTLEQWALESNPTLAQAAAQVEMSQGKALQAGLYPNPTMGYTADQIGAVGTAGELHGFFVQQEIVRGKKLKLGRAKYAQEAASAAADCGRMAHS